MMLLNIKCGQQDTTFTYNGYSGVPPTPIVYNFTIVSRYVCGGGRESSHGGISVDSVMTII
uniref:Uncharacterized protein n=1 Tax=Arion vulgaris TaxID=1028688 RepID=A0A0B6YS62_9EUPU